MAQISMITNAFLLAVIAAVFSAVANTVSAQEDGLAPAPSPVVGAGFSLPISGAVIGTSMIFSLIALLRH